MEEGGGSAESEGEVTVVVEDDHPHSEYVVEQPKLLLADPVEPRPEKEPLPPSLTNSGNHCPSTSSINVSHSCISHGDYTIHVQKL